MAFEIFVISAPGPVKKEFEQVNGMFEAGLGIFHLRKPGYSSMDYLQALKQIKPAYLRRVILHDHYELAAKYNVGGFHLTRKSLEQKPDLMEELFKIARKKGLKLSSSLHSVQELRLVTNKFDYYFLSPIFDSISKPGYEAKLDMEQVKTVLKEVSLNSKIIGLGGVDVENLKTLTEGGFNGAAVIGSIWNSSDPLSKFKELKNMAVS